MISDATGDVLACSSCGAEILNISYTVNGELLCPDCYCKKWGVCG